MKPIKISDYTIYKVLIRHDDDFEVYSPSREAVDKQLPQLLASLTNAELVSVEDKGRVGDTYPDAEEQFIQMHQEDEGTMH